MKKTLYEFSSSPQAVATSRRSSPRNPNGKTKYRSLGNDARVKPSNGMSESRIKWLLEQSRRLPVDISANLVEQMEDTEVVATTTQTADFMPRPKTPPYVPKKTGVDRGTQIEEEDNLFDFDKEVEPILDVIVSKTLAQSLYEVRHEGEMAYLGKTKEYYNSEKDKLREKEREREKQQIQRFKEKEEIKKREMERLRRELLVCEKTAAVAHYQATIGARMQNRVFAHLEEIEHFRDEVRDAITFDFLPWLTEEVDKLAAQKEVCAKLAEALVAAALRRRTETALGYRQAIEDRKRAEIERIQREKDETEQERLHQLELKRETIKIYLRGEDVVGEDVVGPIALSLKDTIAGAEEKIHSWLVENLEHGKDLEKPVGGYLRLALQIQDDDESFDPADTERTLEFLTFMDDCVVKKEEEEEE